MNRLFTSSARFLSTFFTHRVSLDPSRDSNQTFIFWSISLDLSTYMVYTNKAMLSYILSHSQTKPPPIPDSRNTVCWWTFKESICVRMFGRRGSVSIKSCLLIFSPGHTNRKCSTFSSTFNSHKVHSLDLSPCGFTTLRNLPTFVASPCWPLISLSIILVALVRYGRHLLTCHQTQTLIHQ